MSDAQADYLAMCEKAGIDPETLKPLSDYDGCSDDGPAQKFITEEKAQKLQKSLMFAITEYEDCKFTIKSTKRDIKLYRLDAYHAVKKKRYNKGDSIDRMHRAFTRTSFSYLACFIAHLKLKEFVIQYARKELSLPRGENQPTPKNLKGVHLSLSKEIMAKISQEKAIQEQKEKEYEARYIENQKF
jgi:hypothetical protein